MYLVIEKIYFNKIKVFNGCPLRIHCTASWIHPDTRDQHLLIAAEEGIYNLNLNEIHETAIDQLYPRRTIWMYVIKDVLMSLSGNYQNSKEKFLNKQFLKELIFTYSFFRKNTSTLQARSFSHAKQANAQVFASHE